MAEDGEFVAADAVGHERDVSDDPPAVPGHDRDAVEDVVEPVPNRGFAERRRPLCALGRVERGLHRDQPFARVPSYARNRTSRPSASANVNGGDGSSTAGGPTRSAYAFRTAPRYFETTATHRP